MKRDRKRTYYAVGMLLCILAAVLIVIAVRAFMSVTPSHSYPYVDQAVFSQEKYSTHMGQPCYAVIKEIRRSEESVIAATEYGEIKLSLDASAPLAVQFPESFEGVKEIFFVCCGWDNSLNMPWGYFLGAVDAENKIFAGLPAYTEAEHYYLELRKPSSNEASYHTPYPEKSE